MGSSIAKKEATASDGAEEDTTVEKHETVVTEKAVETRRLVRKEISCYEIDVPTEKEDERTEVEKIKDKLKAIEKQNEESIEHAKKIEALMPNTGRAGGKWNGWGKRRGGRYLNDRNFIYGWRGNNRNWVVPPHTPVGFSYPQPGPAHAAQLGPAYYGPPVPPLYYGPRIHSTPPFYGHANPSASTGHGWFGY